MNDKILRFEKILRWIPYVNFITVYFWIYAIIKNSVPAKKYLKDFLFLILIVVVSSIPRIVVDLAFQNQILYRIITLVTTLIELYIISFVAVKKQIQITDKTEK